jgi:hypothetical protein
MPRFVLENTTTEHVEAWLVATLRGYNDVRMPGRVGEIERIDPDEGHPYVLYWVDVVIPRSRDGTCYPMALEARMLQIGPDTVRLELYSDQVAQPWLERLVTDLENDFELQPDRPTRGKGGAPRLEERIDWPEKVAKAQQWVKLIKERCVTQEAAAERIGYDVDTLRTWARRAGLHLP